MSSFNTPELIEKLRVSWRTNKKPGLNSRPGFWFFNIRLVSTTSSPDEKHQLP